MNPTNTWVAAAILGILTGAAACGSAQSNAGARPPDPRAVPSDKSACGNHPGSACAAVSPRGPSK
jgi:hypothetical protein